MATSQDLKNEIMRQRGFYDAHPSVQWFNQRTGAGYGPDAYFCASGLTQALAAIGLGSATGGPQIWTVGWLRWCQNNLQEVSLDDARPGDIAFLKFGTVGDRGSAEVNHVTSVDYVDGDTVGVLGFNEGRGGTGGWVGETSYSRRYVRHVFRTPFNATPSTPKPRAQEDEEMLVRFKNGGDMYAANVSTGVFFRIPNPEYDTELLTLPGVVTTGEKNDRQRDLIRDMCARSAASSNPAIPSQITASIDPKVIAAAIPTDLAKQVVDALAERLAK